MIRKVKGYSGLYIRTGNFFLVNKTLFVKSPDQRRCRYMVEGKTVIRKLDPQAGDHNMAHQGKLFNEKEYAHQDDIKQVNFVHSNEYLICI